MKNTLMVGAALCALALASPANAAMHICPAGAACDFTDDHPAPPPPPPPPLPPAAPAPTYVPVPVPQARPDVAYRLGMQCRLYWGAPGWVDVVSEYDANDHPVGIAVVWHIAEGVFSRGAQYHNIQLWGSGATMGWHGVHNGDPEHTTRGDAIFTGPGMSYSETHFKNGVREPSTKEDPNPQVRRACTVTEPGPLVYE